MKRKILHFLYIRGFRKIAFLVDPEFVHDHAIRIGSVLGKIGITRWLIHSLFFYKHPALEQNIAGIHFSNPIGLSEGFDKDGNLVTILADVGFGFTQVGSVTLHAYEGNQKPRLMRLPHLKSIVVNYGLKSEGADAVITKLQRTKSRIPVSISIAKTNSAQNATDVEAITDYVETYKRCIETGVGDFYTINISCPNTFGGEPFTTPERLQKLIKAVKAIPSKKPLFVKMPINLPWENFKSLLDVLVDNAMTGVIIGNLQKDRSGISGELLPNSVKGNLSGKPTQELSDSLIKYTYLEYKDKLIIVGVGGVFTADDAYTKIKNGASLVQLITGMIYEGPQVIGSLNEGLVTLLQKDGFTSIHDAIGTSCK